MNQNMGMLGIMDPFTAINIRDRMIDSGVPNANTDMVNQLWTAYQDDILEKKLLPFTKDAKWLPTFNDLLHVTQQPKMTVTAFLTALRSHAADNATMQYLDPAQGQASRQKVIDDVKSVISAPGKIFQAASKPLINAAADAGKALSTPLMWVAIGAASLAVLYVTFQFAPMFKAKKKGKG